ncbi:Uncharacterised protein [uncultured Comamonas sp.]|nr:Uncharacterised protein [uncultured Comamonas sp.]
MDLSAGQILKELDLPKGCKLIGGAIEFESFEVRNTIVAAAVYQRLSLTSEIDANALFERAYELWCKEIGRSDQASGRLLALAAGSVDVLATGARRIRSGSNVFDVLHLVEAALPYLEDLAAPSIIDLIAAKYEPTKNDMVAGAINGALERWLEKRPSVALELHDKVLENLSEATSSLLGNAIVALSKSDYAAGVEMARTDTRSDLLMQAQVGTWTLGRLLLDERAPPEAINIVVEAVIDLVRGELPDLRSQAIRASVSAMHTTAAFDSLLQSLAEVGDQDVLCAAASALFFKSKEIRERGLTQRWLQLLTALKPEFKGAIRDLDYALSQLLSNPADAEIVVATLGQWVANHGQPISIDSSTAELFNDTLRTLSSLEENWSSLVTDWLLSDRQAHAAALAAILNQFSHHSVTDIKLDKSRLDELSTDGLLFLARRILGYVHDRAQVTSLALSMLQSNDAEKRIYPVLRPLLVEEIGYDYPGTTADALHKAAQEISSEGNQEFLRAAAGAISQVTGAQNALPSINELRPPTRLRRLFSRARAKQMDKSFEEANKNSNLRQIATHIPLKAGAGTFNYRDSSYGPSTTLSSVSHSIELPRREVFDPIGNSIRHLGFRLAKRDEP